MPPPDAPAAAGSTPVAVPPVGQSKLNKSPVRVCYKLGQTLGTGSFATVRLGTCLKTGKKFALKIIEKAQFAVGDHSLENEISILCSVTHPNIVNLEEWFDESSKVVLVMEFVTGGALFDRIVDTGRYSERDARKSFVEICRGLKYLHDRGIAHRDLKPENFLLSANGPEAEVKIADFGLSKFFAGDSGGMSTICGTPQYVAPEVLDLLENKKSGQQSYSGTAADAWSLGVNLYVMLCGYPPFDGDNQALLFQAIRKGQWEFDGEGWVDISQNAKDIVKGLMTQDWKTRLTIAEAMEHPWARGDDLPDANLSTAMVAIRRLTAARRFKKVILATKALARFRMAMKGGSKTLDEGEGSAAAGSDAAAAGPA